MMVLVRMNVDPQMIVVVRRRRSPARLEGDSARVEVGGDAGVRGSAGPVEGAVPGSRVVVGTDTSVIRRRGVLSSRGDEPYRV